MSMTSEEMNVIDMDIADLELSVRSYNSLKRAGIDTVGQLVELSDDELLKLKNFGVRCLNEVHGKLASYYRRKQTYAELEQENSKLRELIADVHEALCADKAGMFHKLTLASMEDDMRELGIEVAE